MDDAGGRHRHLGWKPEIAATEAAGPEYVGSGYRPPLVPEQRERRAHQCEEKHSYPQHHTGILSEIIHHPTPAFALRRGRLSPPRFALRRGSFSHGIKLGGADYVRSGTRRLSRDFARRRRLML